MSHSGIAHGFELLRDETVAEIASTARVYRHVKTGARVVSVANADENKVFGITFRTPVDDSSGLPHILEHSVLCGSRKYPVKEPFVELLKCSLQTFLNAFTYPDKTCYPVASCNLQDFYNLIDVYLDAVFHPRLTPWTLMQEGWRLAPDSQSEGGAPILKGVVFNEMRGAYASPERVLAEYSQQVLFPDVTYGYDSGGDPLVIPSLDFEKFMAFHKRLYHPSNAWVWFYGDDDPERRLAILAEYFEGFEAHDPASEVALQTPFPAPRRESRRYACNLDESGQPCGPRAMVTLNWLLPAAADPEMNLAFDMLEHILIGLPGSPLRKALIDSGLGEDLTGGGWESELRQMSFSTGLKGVDPGQEGKVETLILDELERLAAEGVGEAAIEAAMNTVEFALRENNTGSFPRGLSLMLRSLTSWLYEGDPLAILRFESPLAALKTRLASGEKVFETMIRRHFLDNPHRVTLSLVPDAAVSEKYKADEASLTAELVGPPSPARIREIAETAARLDEMQSAPDDPAQLAAIPRLRLADMERKNTLLPLEELTVGGVPACFHDLETSGVAYLDLGMDLSGMPLDQAAWTGLLGRAILEMGAAGQDFVELTQRIARKTGGLYADGLISNRRGVKDPVAWSFLRGKATFDKLDDLLDILSDVLLDPKLDDQERFRQLLLEEKAREEHRLTPAGHQLVATRLRARMGPADYAAEMMGGVSYLFRVRQLLEAVETDWPRVLASLQDMLDSMRRRGGMLLNLTMSRSALDKALPSLERFMGRFPAPVHNGNSHKPLWRMKPLPQTEGLSAPMNVQFVGLGFNLYETGYAFHGSALAANRLLRTSYLWDRVRVRGGAYGCFCALDRFGGGYVFSSYRDPNLLETLAAYREAGAWLEHETPDDAEIEKAVIGAIGDVDAYMLPDAKGWTAMVRKIVGDDPAGRQVMREELLGAGRAHLKAYGAALTQAATNGAVVVLASDEALRKAAPELEGLRITKAL